MNYHTIILKIYLSKLKNNTPNLVEHISKRIEDYTKESTLNNGYKYFINELLIFLKTDGPLETESIYNLFNNEKIDQNDLLTSSELYFSYKENASIDDCIKIDYHYLTDITRLKKEQVINVTDEEIDKIAKDFKIKFTSGLRNLYKNNNGKKIESFPLSSEENLIELYPLKYGISVECLKCMNLFWLKEDLFPIGETDADSDIYWNTNDNGVYRIYHGTEEEVLINQNIDDFISNISIE